MANTRPKDAPDALADLTGYYFCVDKNGQPSFEKVAIPDNFNKDTGYVTFINFAPEATTVAENQLRQKGNEVHGFIRVAVSPSISGGILCELPSAVDAPSEDILTYAVDHLNSGATVIVRVLTTGEIEFASTNDGQWYIKIDYSV